MSNIRYNLKIHDNMVPKYYTGILTTQLVYKTNIVYKKNLFVRVYLTLLYAEMA